MMIVQVSAPITDLEEEEVDEIYDQVQFDIETICKQNVLLVIPKIEMPKLQILKRKM